MADLNMTTAATQVTGWLTAAKDDASKMATDFLQGRVTPKRTREDNGSASSALPPWGPEECEWLSTFVGGAVQASATSMAQAVHHRFTVVETTQALQQEQLADLTQRMAALETSGGSQSHLQTQVREDITILQTQVQQIRSVEPSLEGGQRPQQSTSEMPREMRTHAVIGSLGWNLNETQILERAREVLSAAQVKEGDDFTHLSVPRTPGSLAELFFSNGIALAKAKVAVRNQRKKYVENREVWLDTKKSEKELKPSKTIHRLQRVLTDFELAKPEQQRIVFTKNMMLREIKAGEVPMGRLHFGKWRWTPEALTRFTQTELDSALEWALDE